MIAFQNFKRQVFGKSKNSEREEQAIEAGITPTKQFSKKSISMDETPSLNTQDYANSRQ